MLALMFVTLLVVRTVQPVPGARARARAGGTHARRVAPDDVQEDRLPDHPSQSPGVALAFAKAVASSAPRDHHGQRPVRDRGLVRPHLRADRERRLGRSLGGRRRPARDLVPDPPSRSVSFATSPRGTTMTSLVSRLGLRLRRSAIWRSFRRAARDRLLAHVRGRFGPPGTPSRRRRRSTRSS